MNTNIILDLVELGIYSLKTLSEDEYNDRPKNDTNNSLIYLTQKYEGPNGEPVLYYKEIDTKGLTPDELNLKLQIVQTKYAKSTKNMIKFFVIITVISMIITFLWALFIVGPSI